MRHIVEVNEFFVEGRARESSHVLLHITEPSTPEEMRKGYFFALAEIEHGSSENIEHIQKMIDDLESGYYETEDEEDKSAFEIALEFINRRSHHLIPQSGTKLHAIVGTVREGIISMAYRGEPTGLVFYQGKSGYETLSILGGGEAPSSEQLFSSILEGEIQPDDFFFVATPHVANYFSKDRIHKIVTGRSARESAMHLQKVLGNLRANESFGGILFHLVTIDQLPKTGKMPTYLRQGSADSLNRLISSQRTTDELLYPPVLSRAAAAIKKSWQKDDTSDYATPNQKRRVRETPEYVGETNNRRREEEKEEQPTSTRLVGELGNALLIAGKFLWLVIERLALFARDLSIALFLLATNKGGQRTYIKEKIRHDISRRRDYIRTMPGTAKILLATTIGCALLFVGSIVFLKVKESRTVATEAYNQQIAVIVDKRDAAEASLLYKDSEKAFTLLKEAEGLLATLSPKKADKQKIESLRASIEGHLQELRKVETATPVLVANMVSSTKAGIDAIVSLGDNIVAFGHDNPNYFIVHPQSGVVESRDHATIPHLAAASTPKENDFSLFITDTGDIATLDPLSLTLSAKTISYPGAALTPADLIVYNRRVYILDPKGQQIYKHSPTSDGYDKGTVWIKERTTDMSDGVSIAADGDIFVLKKTGVVIKFTNGKEQSFVISGLDPALGSGAQIWTYNDMKYIYLLDPVGKRLVVLDKNGVLIKQIISTVWQAPVGMIVSGDETSAFVLDSGKIYKIGL